MKVRHNNLLVPDSQLTTGNVIHKKLSRVASIAAPKFRLVTDPVMSDVA